MNNKKEIESSLINGLDKRSIEILKQSIELMVNDLNNINNGLIYSDQEQLQLLENEVNKRKEIANKKTIAGEVTGLEFRFLDVISVMINNNKINQNNNARKIM